MSQIRRIFVEKKEGYNVEAQSLLADFKESLQLDELEDLRLINRYDIADISDQAYQQAKKMILSEPPVDKIYEEELDLADEYQVFGVEYLPGQYDQRADSAKQCIQIIKSDEEPIVRAAKIILLAGDLSAEDVEKIKDYYINPVDSREADLAKPDSLELDYNVPEKVDRIEGFIEHDRAGLEDLLDELGLAMSIEDLLHTQNYYQQEKRDPTITEIRLLDTYWSDHCRHTTFLTDIQEVEIEDGTYTSAIKAAYQKYLSARKTVYQAKEAEKDICLMDIALMGMKELRKAGELDDLEVSEEVNASSIVVEVDIDGENEEWLIMFKNETHNHPTEIEPFGGAATCLGGCIRDPLAGRSYVYQAMRVSGSGDPRVAIEETIPGKLPQKKIAQEASDGYSSYGNQIGLATGEVKEIYNQRYLAKHMEIGAVVAATPKADVVRKSPQPGDIILLVGGKTGRDGCGGATGSSKEHTTESINTCEAEVQKGNPPTERKIQRLFRKSEASRLIKKCNDFGAGGVAVAIGELADSLKVNLNVVPKKYEGLDGTELAISESQERMAVVVDKSDAAKFKELAKAENLEATQVAEVTNSGRLIMEWNDDAIVDLSREFLNTNGATQESEVFVEAPANRDNYFEVAVNDRLASDNLKEQWLENLADLNICSQKGLVEKFDSTVGAGSVLMPYGGKYQLSPTQSMVAKVPTLKDETNTGTIMSSGYNPDLAIWSPFHGALYAVVDSVAKVVATGGDYSQIRFTFQEYFESLRDEASRWGKPFSALLGAYQAQKGFGLPAVGGKDSMSGTFHDLDVPPTLVSFAVDTVDVNHVISPEFKAAENKVVYLPIKRDEEELPDFEQLKSLYQKVNQLIKAGSIVSARAITRGGIAEAVSKMAFGNKLGIDFSAQLSSQELFSPQYGALVVEISGEEKLADLLAEVDYQLLGETTAEEVIKVNGAEIDLAAAIKSWEQPLEKIYPTKTADKNKEFEFRPYEVEKEYSAEIKVAKPKVLIPVFPGTNCEYDTAEQFKQAGGEVETLIFKNQTPKQIENSVQEMAEAIKNSQIVTLAGGFSAGDEPEGAGKFIAAVFRNPAIKAAVNDLLSNRDGLMLGICNGFQALLKLGLLPFGEITELTEDSPTLTYNQIGRHVSCAVETKIVSNQSPWLSNVEVGDVHSIPVSHGEGRFVAPEKELEKLFKQGQVATQYVDKNGNPTSDMPDNPNGSMRAIEGITSPDGRILGKMGHSERIGKNVAKNIVGNKDQQLFKAGIEYFTK